MEGAETQNCQENGRLVGWLERWLVRTLEPKPLITNRNESNKLHLFQ